MGKRLERDVEKRLGKSLNVLRNTKNSILNQETTKVFRFNIKIKTVIP